MLKREDTKIEWVERLIVDVETMTIDELLASERKQHRLEREIDRGYQEWATAHCAVHVH